MREPTTETAALEWHSEAMKDLDVYIPPAAINDEPRCGWFKTRLVKGGPWLPVRIYLDQDVNDETKELQNPEVMRCQLVYVDRDPVELWPYVCGHPIPRKEYEHLLKLGDWAAEYMPKHPINQPFKARTKADIPMPNFS